MANGMLADRNRVPAATVSETGWSAAAPAANAKVLPLCLTARSVAAATTAAPVILQGTFDARRPITYAGLFQTNLGQAGAVRLQLFADAAMTLPLFDTRDPLSGRDRRVMPNLFDWRQLRFGAPNLLRGDLEPEDYGLYPANIHVAVPICRPLAFRWTFYGPGLNRATGLAAGFVEIGHAWFSDSVQFRINYAYGGANGWTPTDTIKRTPGGGVTIEPGIGYRTVDIPYDWIEAADGHRLFDLTKRVGWSLPVVWLPDIDCPAELFRYGFIGQRRDTFKKTWKSYQLDAATLQIEEITT